MTERRNVVGKRVLDARHVRKIREGFSWIDRRFVREEWIDRLSVEENALYFFLVAVADKDGLSFYSDGRIVTMLKIDHDRFFRARARLIELGLVAWERPLYQVLEVPTSVADGLRRSAR
jgi:hypothetical protein